MSPRFLRLWLGGEPIPRFLRREGLLHLMLLAAVLVMTPRMFSNWRMAMLLDTVVAVLGFMQFRLHRLASISVGTLSSRRITSETPLRFTTRHLTHPQILRTPNAVHSRIAAGRIPTMRMATALAILTLPVLISRAFYAIHGAFVFLAVARSPVDLQPVATLVCYALLQLLRVASCFADT